MPHIVSECYHLFKDNFVVLKLVYFSPADIIYCYSCCILNIIKLFACFSVSH